jgi:hypothetical protein
MPKQAKQLTYEHTFKTVGLSCKFSQQVHKRHVTMVLNSGNEEQTERSTHNKDQQHFTKNRTACVSMAYFQTV